MRIKDGFVLREVAGQAVVIAVGEASKAFHGMINLNNTGKVIWQEIENGLSEDEIVDNLLEKYDADVETVKCDVKSMIQKMRDAGVLE